MSDCEQKSNVKLVVLHADWISACLSRNAGMICSWHPESAVAAHAPKASDDIFQGDKHGMAHVQGASNIRWWPVYAISIIDSSCTAGNAQACAMSAAFLATIEASMRFGCACQGG